MTTRLLVYKAKDSEDTREVLVPAREESDLGTILEGVMNALGTGEIELMGEVRIDERQASRLLLFDQPYVG
jgi:hypothetical protein